MMARMLLILGLVCLLESVNADEVIWKGEVKSDGAATASIPLKLKQTYQIKASQFINLGKWNQAGEKLANDACYEFNKEKSIEKVESLKNSLDIAICDGTYHKDHVYLSKPFLAKQNRIFFWVYDTDYDDNNDSFYVEVIRKGK